MRLTPRQACTIAAFTAACCCSGDTVVAAAMWLPISLIFAWRCASDMECAILAALRLDMLRCFALNTLAVAASDSLPFITCD